MSGAFKRLSLPLGLIIASLVATTRLLAEPNVSASGFAWVNDTDQNDAATNTSAIRPVHISCAVTFVTGSAFADYGTNRTSVTVTGPHYPCASYLPPAKCAGYSGGEFLSTWTDRITITGAPSNCTVFWLSIRLSAVASNTVASGEIAINDAFAPSPLSFGFRLPDNTGIHRFGPINFTNGIPVKIDSRLAASAGLAGPVMTGAYQYQQVSASSELLEIFLPDGAVLSSESQRIYPTRSMSSGLEISLDATNAVLKWLELPGCYSSVETTTNLNDELSWAPAGNPEGEWPEYYLTLPREEPMRFFRRIGIIP